MKKKKLKIINLKLGKKKLRRKNTLKTRDIVIGLQNVNQRVIELFFFRFVKATEERKKKKFQLLKSMISERRANSKDQTIDIVTYFQQHCQGTVFALFNFISLFQYLRFAILRFHYKCHILKRIFKTKKYY